MKVKENYNTTHAIGKPSSVTVCERVFTSEQISSVVRNINGLFSTVNMTIKCLPSELDKLGKPYKETYCSFNIIIEPTNNCQLACISSGDNLISRLMMYQKSYCKKNFTKLVSEVHDHLSTFSLKSTLLFDIPKSYVGNMKKVFGMYEIRDMGGYRNYNTRSEMKILLLELYGENEPDYDDAER